MSMLNLAQMEAQKKVNEFEGYQKELESKRKDIDAKIKAQSENLASVLRQHRGRLDKINSELSKQKLNKDILKEIIDMREDQPQGKAVVGNQPIPVSPDAQGLPLVDQLASRR